MQVTICFAGVEESVISSNLDTSPDLRRALSLLSTSSWGSCGTKAVSQGAPNNVNQTGIPQPAMHAITQGVTLASEYWQTEQLSVDNPSSHISNNPRSNGTNHFQDLNLFRTPFESGFYPNQFD